VLDKILVDAAIAAGAEFREGFSVRELITEGERVIGIRGHTRDGTIVPEYAPLVVGADGRHSLMARTVHAPRYHVKPVLTCCYYSYWSGVPIEGVEFSLYDSRMVIGFPTNEDLVCILVDWPHQAFPEFRTDVVGNYLKTVERTPELAQRARQGKREERVVGAADLPNFFRKPYGPGWALVGDAGYHKDPVTAQGISDAFRDAELLAEAIDAGLSGREALDDALANYEAQRNEAALPMYELTSQLARLQTSFEMEQLFHALQRNQDETNRFLGTIVGTVSIPQFFSASNLQRIIAG
jgi:flavin-dependent dehydrogenase